ncbi:hypothetical protein CDL15_Pgr012473 [Punica granatum]|uniref:Uncharacterized protein n=1 Tax=Punica granatum TaxID=22663 RepID=A0A218WZV8_PUNGR|nr:hypothetical protein CDL15_Pgr012473 [Punica granatum]
MLFNFGSPERHPKSLYFSDANGGPAFKGLDAMPSRLLLALHGNIEMFSKVPKQLYRLFDAPAGLGTFSSGYRRVATFVTCMGDFCANLVRPRSSHFQSVMTRLPEMNV